MPFRHGNCELYTDEVLYVKTYFEVNNKTGFPPGWRDRILYYSSTTLARKVHVAIDDFNLVIMEFNPILTLSSILDESSSGLYIF